MTIACGAISGFHELVSSSTTSKQLCKATDARPIGYGAMLAEASLAILATMAVACGLWAGPEHQHAWGFLEASTLEGVSGGALSAVGGVIALLTVWVALEGALAWRRRLPGGAEKLRPFALAPPGR